MTRGKVPGGLLDSSLDGAADSVDLTRGSACPGSYADEPRPVEPGGIELVGSLDMIRARAQLGRNLRQTLGIGRDPSSDNDHDISSGGQLCASALMTARGVADGVDDAHLLCSSKKSRDDALEIRPRLRRLDDHADLFTCGKIGDLGRIAHDDRPGSMGKRGLDLRMTRLSDNNDLIALSVKPGSGKVDLLHKRTSGVEDVMAELSRSALLIGG